MDDVVFCSALLSLTALSSKEYRTICEEMHVNVVVCAVGRRHKGGAFNASNFAGRSVHCSRETTYANHSTAVGPIVIYDDIVDIP